MIEPSILAALDTLASRYGAECAAHEITKARLAYAMEKIGQLEARAKSADGGSVPGDDPGQASERGKKEKRSRRGK